MGDSEGSLPPTKKRAAGRELNRDRPELDDEENTSEPEGTFKKASSEVLATRRIVKVRRSQTASAPSSNPFAGIRLVPPPSDVDSTAAPVCSEKETSEKDAPKETENEEEEAKSESEGENQQSDNKVEAGETESSAVEKVDDVVAVAAADEKGTDEADHEAPKPDEGDDSNKEPKNDVENADSAASVSSFQQLSSTKNAFTGFAGTGFSTATFSFGSIPSDGSAFGFNPEKLPFSFSIPTNGNSSLFGGPGASKPEGSSSFPSMQEVVVETGEENEKVVFSADSILFEFTDGSWKERGKGEIKVNVSTTEPKKARIVMRTKGNYRLILNAGLYPEMKLTSMDKKGITFACVNSATEGKAGLTTFAAKFKDPSVMESFREAVTAHKGKEEIESVKTPENSPKASED